MKTKNPFYTHQEDGNFAIIAPLDSDELLEIYYPFFEEHGYEGNGYCWEGHIIQILEKVDKDLLDHIEFDPEAGGFYAYADSAANQQKFMEILGPIFSDLGVLETYVSAADRSRIDD